MAHSFGNIGDGGVRGSDGRNGMAVYWYMGVAVEALINLIAASVMVEDWWTGGGNKESGGGISGTVLVMPLFSKQPFLGPEVLLEELWRMHLRSGDHRDRKFDVVRM